MSESAKLPYFPPVLDLYNYAVEHGFADSFPANASTDTYSEINSNGGGEHGTGNVGENYHGEWY